MKSIIILYFIVISLLSAAQHAVLYPVSLEEQLEVSSIVVEGELTSQKSVWNNSKNLIYTLNTINVYKVFVGECPRTITIITEGGIVGNHMLQISESLQLREGDHGVFILKKNTRFMTENDNIYDVVSDIQGFFKYDLINNTARNPFLSFTGIETDFYNYLTEKTEVPIARFQEIDYKIKIRFATI